MERFTSTGRHPDAQLIAAMLRQVKVGEVITYEQIEEAVRYPVQAPSRGYQRLRTARAMVRGERIIFDVVAKVGLRRLDSSGTVGVASSYVKRAQKNATKGLQTLAAADFDQLDETHKREHTTAAAQLGAIKMFSGASARKKLETVQVPQTGRLSLEQTLQMFQGGK